MTTRKEVMQKLVKKEAKNLKKLATTEELEKLNFTTLNSESRYCCIYGQIANECNTERAQELIIGCCDRVYKANQDKYIHESKINGSPKNKDRNKYWSPIEVFIDTEKNKNNGNNEKLIKYLKGETTRLNFK